MPRKTTAQVFAEVDPNLRVIPGGKRNSKRRTRAKTSTKAPAQQPEPYTPRVMTNEDWEKAEGGNCTRCGQESFILFNHSLGRVCKKCYLELCDNWVDEGEDFKAKLLDDGSIILYHGKTKGS